MPSLRLLYAYSSDVYVIKVDYACSEPREVRLCEYFQLHLGEKLLSVFCSTDEKSLLREFMAFDLFWPFQNL